MKSIIKKSMMQQNRHGLGKYFSRNVVAVNVGSNVRVTGSVQTPTDFLSVVIFRKWAVIKWRISGETAAWLVTLVNGSCQAVLKLRTRALELYTYGYCMGNQASGISLNQVLNLPTCYFSSCMLLYLYSQNFHREWI
jgi:hypothetical protein